MNNQSLRIEQGDAMSVVTDADSTVQVWGVNGKEQDVLLHSMSASATLILGPYMDVQQFRVENLTGNAPTITILGKGSITPSTLKAMLGVPDALVAGDAVDDAVDADDIVAQFNALLASLRANGVLAESE